MKIYKNLFLNLFIYLENPKFEIKQKRIGPIKKRIFDPPSHKRKRRK